VVISSVSDDCCSAELSSELKLPSSTSDAALRFFVDGISEMLALVTLSSTSLVVETKQSEDGWGRGHAWEYRIDFYAS